MEPAREAPSANDESAEVGALIKELGLKPGTCGYMRPAYSGEFGVVIEFLITPLRSGRLHAIGHDQVYHFYGGTPLDVLLIENEHPRIAVVGPRGIENGSQQLVIASGTQHTSRTRGAYTLAATSSFGAEAPAFEEPAEWIRQVAAAEGFT